MKWMRMLSRYIVDAVILICAVQAFLYVIDSINILAGVDGYGDLSTSVFHADISILSFGSIASKQVEWLLMKALLYMVALIVCMIFRIVCNKSGECLSINPPIGNRSKCCNGK